MKNEAAVVMTATATTESGSQTEYDALPDALERIKEVVENPPETWKPYTEKKDWWGIVEMEMREAKTAKVQAKADPSKQPDAVKELSHVAAAVMQMIVNMDKEKS